MGSTKNKVLAFLLAALMIFALAGCGGDGEDGKEEVKKTVADDTSILSMSFSAPDGFETVQREVEKTAKGKLINKGIAYTLPDDCSLTFVFTDADGKKLEDQLGKMKVERKEYNGTEWILYRSSKKTYMAFYQDGENVYGIQYRNSNEETIEDEFDKVLQTVKMTGATETTLNDFSLDKVKYNLETDVPLFSETTTVEEKPDGTLVSKKFVWKYSEDSEKISYRFGIEEHKNTTVKDVVGEKKELEEGQIGDITYSFEKSDKKTDVYDHYNYYIQQGEDVYAVQNKGVSGGLITTRSDESKKAFKKFIKAVKFE